MYNTTKFLIVSDVQYDCKFQLRLSHESNFIEEFVVGLASKSISTIWITNRFKGE